MTPEEALLVAESKEPHSARTMKLALQDLAAEVRRQHKEIERLRALVPPEVERHRGVGQASWSVFAEKVVAERDEARAEIERLRTILDRADVIDEYKGKDGRRDWSRVGVGWLMPGDVVAVLDDWRAKE